MTDLKTIWAMMKATWPHQFKEYGPANGPVFNVWASELREANLDAGLAALRVTTAHFPPSLPEFKQMCGALPSLPKNDQDMQQWAIAHGYGDARPQESWKQYRDRIEAAVAREPKLKLLKNSDAA